MATKNEKILQEIAEYEMLISDKSVPVDEKEFAREQVAELRAKLTSEKPAKAPAKKSFKTKKAHTPEVKAKVEKRKTMSREAISQMSKSDFNAFLKKLSEKPEYAFLKNYNYKQSEVVSDMKRASKPMGWRFKGKSLAKPTESQIASAKKGKRDDIYYEARPEHSDVNPADKFGRGGGLMTEEKIREVVYDFMTPLGYSARVQFIGGNKAFGEGSEIHIEPDTRKVGNNRKDFFDGMQIIGFPDGTFEVSEYMAGENENELYIYKETKSLKEALKDLVKGNKRKPIKKYKKGGAVTEMEFENSNLYLNGFGKDTNGNSIVKVSFPNQRAFSIQTNGVLPTTHDLRGHKLSELSANDIARIEKEVVGYVKEHGSIAQKKSLKTYGGKFATGGGVDYAEITLKYDYPKFKRRPAHTTYYKIDTSKEIKVGGIGEKGYELFFKDGNKSNVVITERQIKDLLNGKTIESSGAKVSISDKYEDGGRVGMSKAQFMDLVKKAMKEKDKWHFINEEVEGNNVSIKMFVGKQVDVQRISINGLMGGLPKNYEGVMATTKMIEKLINEMPSKMAGGGKVPANVKKRLEEIREEIRNESISYGEIAELQSLAKYIDKDDVELLEWAGVEEFGRGGKVPANVKKRLEEIREEIRNESISYGEIAELESLKKYIDKDDVELLQWAGGEEFGRGGKLSSKSKYVPNRMITEISVERKGKETIIDGADVLDGMYVKKGTKFARGGGISPADKRITESEYEDMMGVLPPIMFFNLDGEKVRGFAVDEAYNHVKIGGKVKEIYNGYYEMDNKYFQIGEHIYFDDNGDAFRYEKGSAVVSEEPSMAEIIEEIVEEKGIPESVIIAMIKEYSLDVDSVKDWFDDHYEGEYDSDEDLAYGYVDMIGGLEALGQQTLETYFDYEAFGRDLALNDFHEYDGHYFRYKRGGMMARGGKLSSKTRYIPNRMVTEVAVERKGKETIIDGADIFDGFYVKKGVKFANGGSLDTSGMLYHVVSEMSSGFIASNSNVETYDETGKIRFKMVQILQSEGDRPYSLEGAVALVKEAESKMKNGGNLRPIY